MGNEALPLTRARYGFNKGPQILARYGLVNFFKATAGYIRFMLSTRWIKGLWG